MTLTRLKEFGSWSEQTSSSGKRYYYNRDTEVSQWEKPSEWKEHEKTLIEKFKLSKAQKAGLIKNQHSVKPSTSVSNTSIKNNLTSVSTTTINNKSPNASNSSKYSNVNTNSNKNLFSNESFAVPPGSQKNSLKRMREEDHQSNEINNLYQSVPKAHRNSANFTSLSSTRYSNLPSLSVQTTNTASQQNESRFTTLKLPNVSINSSSNTIFCNTSFGTLENLSTLNRDSPKQHNSNLSLNQQSPHLDSSNQSLRTGSNVLSQTNNSQSQKTTSLVTVPLKNTPNTSTEKTTNINSTKSFNPDNKEAINSLSGFLLKKVDEQQKIQSETNVISQAVIKPSLKFDERKYARFYRADLTAYRKNWSSDAYINEAKKLVERNTKHTSKLNSIDEEIRSVYSLIKAAELRCMLLGQKLTFIRQEITNLETKNRTN